jgi:drug/metabolite transporter (DMT)-like permease
MTSPLIISVLAAMLLAERLGPARWIAISVGFVGVLFIIQPRADGFDGYALVCLLSTVLLSVRDVATRRVHAAVPSDPRHAVEHDRGHVVCGAAVGVRRLAAVQPL